MAATPRAETCAAHCRVRGDGVVEATVRNPTYFWIEAYDQDCCKRDGGGDTFFVAIRGPSQTRARVTDNLDGTYLVVWKPHVSGTYTIAVSLFGEQLEGSPFVVHSSTNNPVASKCIVRGDALNQAVSRQVQAFDVLFKDRLGQTARAVELDVFVEPQPTNSPRSVSRPGTQRVMAADEPVEPGSPTGGRESHTTTARSPYFSAPKGPKKGQKRTPGAKTRLSQDSLVAAAEAEAADEESGDPVANHEVVSDEIETEGALKSDEVRKERSIRVKVTGRPLIVRAGYGKDTEELGLLMPGQVVTVVEERLIPGELATSRTSVDGSTWSTSPAHSGEVRARIALDSVALSIDGLTPKGVSAGDGASTFRRRDWAAKPLTPEQLALREQQRLQANRREAEELMARARLALSKGTPDGIELGQRLVKKALKLEDREQFLVAVRKLLERLERSAVAFGGDYSSMQKAAEQPDPAPPDLTDPVRNLFGGDGADGSSREAPPAPTVGWVTLVKAGEKLVSSRVKLGPGSRRHYVAQWARRRLNDKTESISGHLAKTIMHELTFDPSGVGFAFGGVEPGVLHAQGKLHEVHKVSYSIGLAGRYLLHVRLRQEAAAVVGSPFDLEVLPGPAHAKSTRLSTEILRGKVGMSDQTGTSLLVHTADRMGNTCLAGGATVTIICDYKNMSSRVHDNKDGTYLLRWNSESSGTFKTRVLIDGFDMIGSPREFTLTSSNPNLAKSELTTAPEVAGVPGPLQESLRTAVVGKVATIRIPFFDDFGNIALPDPEVFLICMSLQKEKEKLVNVKQLQDFEGEWEVGDTGVYNLRYMARVSGNCEMHLWCDPQNSGERHPLPGSPFPVAVAAGKANPKASRVDGWSKVQKDEKIGEKHKDAGLLYAGDTVTFRPQVFDAFENQTALPEGAMKIVHALPNGNESELPFQVQVRGGTTTYDVRHDATAAGEHQVRITLFDKQISGSPVRFNVLPDKPEPPFCKLNLPEEDLIVNTECIAVVKTYDKFGNECRSGGLAPQVRLQLIKQGTHDQTALVPSNHSFSNPAEDQGNGEYLIKIKVAIACVFKMQVNLDKNLPGTSGELPAVTLQILHDPAAPPPKEEGTAAQATGGVTMPPRGGRSGGAGRRASKVNKDAIADAVQGAGGKEGRSKSFAFDSSGGNPSSSTGSGTSPSSSQRTGHSPDPFGSQRSSSPNTLRATGSQRSRGSDDDKQLKATGSTRSRGSDEGNLKARSSGGLRAKGSAVSSGGAFSSFASQGSRGSSR